MRQKNEPTDPDLYESVKAEVKKHFLSQQSVWPSAYASGQLTKAYKRAFLEEYGPDSNPYLTTRSDNLGRAQEEPLTRWFQEEWVNVCVPKKNLKYEPCGRAKSNIKDRENYPYCRPLHRINKDTPRTVSEFTEQELEEMCAFKHSLPQGIEGKPTRIYHKKVLQS